MIDFEGLGDLFSSTVDIGVDKMTGEERMVLCARACSKPLRSIWCKVFKLTPEQEALVHEHPFPPFDQWQGRLTFEHRPASAQAVDYHFDGFSDVELEGILSQVLLEWSVAVPGAKGMKPLPLLNSGDSPRDWPAFRARLRPWIRRATANQPKNFPAEERVAAANRRWKDIIETVYSTPRLNGTVPGRRGCSLEWLSECEVNSHGKPFPLIRLERLMAGQYKLPSADAAVMERAG